MHARWPTVLVLAFLCACVSADDQRADDRQPALDFLFTRTPFTTECDPPRMPSPGSGAYAVLTGPPPAPHVVRRTDVVSFSRAELPALAVAGGPDSTINIQGTDAKDWSARLCAMGGGSSESEAADILRQVGMRREGALLSVSTPRSDRVSRATVVLDAPRDAPIVVNVAYSAVAVHDMTGPVRVSAMHGRVTVLATGGDVTAAGDAVDFASDRGQVFLDAAAEANVKMIATRFDGTVDARARRAVRVLVPPRFESSIEAIVTSADAFVCRAEICSRFKQTRQGSLHIFRYAGTDPAAAAPPVLRLQSEEATVTIDTTARAPAR